MAKTETAPSKAPASKAPAKSAMCPTCGQPLPPGGEMLAGAPGGMAAIMAAMRAAKSGQPAVGGGPLSLMGG
jgi:hypothetical protein